MSAICRELYPGCDLFGVHPVALSASRDRLFIDSHIDQIPTVTALHLGIAEYLAQISLKGSHDALQPYRVAQPVIFLIDRFDDLACPHILLTEGY